MRPGLAPDPRRIETNPPNDGKQGCRANFAANPARQLWGSMKGRVGLSHRAPFNNSAPLGGGTPFKRLGQVFFRTFWSIKKFLWGLRCQLV